MIMVNKYLTNTSHKIKYQIHENVIKLNRKFHFKKLERNCKLIICLKWRISCKIGRKQIHSISPNNINSLLAWFRKVASKPKAAVSNFYAGCSKHPKHELLLVNALFLFPTQYGAEQQPLYHNPHLYLLDYPPYNDWYRGDAPHLP